MELHPSVERYLAGRRAPAFLKRRVKELVEELRRNPIPSGWDIAKVRGMEDAFRVRIGDYRVIYAVSWERLLILILDVGPRGKIRYR